MINSMTSQPPIPSAADEPALESHAAPGLPNHPEFEPIVPVKKRRRVVLLLVPLLVLALATAGVGGYRYYLAHYAAKRTTAQLDAADPYAGWKTYTSTSEQASFRYPSGWRVASYSITSSDPSNTDHTGIVSPSGAITISWVTDLAGFGNEHSATFPQNTVIDKMPIPTAAGLYVVSGITTLDGSIYHPWIAVQDSDGILASGVQGNIVTFTSRRALNPTTNDVTGILFSTSGARTNQYTPALTKAQADAWFSGAEAKQAKLILLSLADAPNQFLTIKAWSVKLPLSAPIQDAYYSTMNSGTGADGLPNTAWLSLRSLDTNGCDIAATGPSVTEDPIGSIIRVLPSDRDPVSNMLYTQEYPGGVTIGGYYYAFVPWKHNTCASASTLKIIDSAFVAGAARISAATATVKVPELGIEITVPDSLKDLQYVVDTTSVPGTTFVRLTTASLEAMDGASSQCTAAQSALGVMWKMTSSPADTGARATTYKQVGAAYILYDHPQQGCSNKPATNQLQSSQATLLETAIQTAQTI